MWLSSWPWSKWNHETFRTDSVWVSNLGHDAGDKHLTCDGGERSADASKPAPPVGLEVGRPRCSACHGNIWGPTPLSL